MEQFKNSKLNSRKLIGSVLLITLATIIVFFTDISADLFDKWSMFVWLIYSSYILGNIGEHYTKKKQ